MPSVKYITTSLITNSMFVFDIQYCEFIVGKPASFNFKEIGHTTASLLATSAIGSVVCKDPSKILYYKDFIIPPNKSVSNTEGKAEIIEIV